MGYVNERVPEEEKKAYMIPGYKEITPSYWTIDKEKNIKLFKYWTNMDAPKEIYFAFVWEEKVIDIILIKDVKGNVVQWNMKGMSVSEEILPKRETVLDELRQALKAFGLFGHNIENAPKIEIKVNF